jgi:hypothetical protein
VQLGGRSGGWPLRFDVYEPVLAAGLGRPAGGASVIAAAEGATVSGMAGGRPAASGGARGARRSLTLGRLSRLEIETMECLRDCSGHQSKVTS